MKEIYEIIDQLNRSINKLMDIVNMHTNNDDTLFQKIKALEKRIEKLEEENKN